jgi:uncharacterized membrane protein
MATASAPTALQLRSWLRPSYSLWSFIVMMIGYVLVHNESFLMNRSDPECQHIQSFKWWLLPHGLAGACTNLLGPMQFFDRIRQRFTKLHRVVGRIYVFAALIAAPFGAYIQYFEERMGERRSFTIATVVDAFLLMSTTGIAFYFAWRRKIPQHRAWMTRSFACALIFLEVRVIGGVTGWENIPGATETIVWSCVAMSLLWADIVLQIQESRRARGFPVKATVNAISRVAPVES